MGFFSKWFKRQTKKQLRKGVKKGIGSEGYSFFFNLSSLFTGKFTLGKLFRFGKSTKRVTEKITKTISNVDFQERNDLSEVNTIPKTSEGGYIYVVGLDNSEPHYKIGYSKDPERRISSLSTGTPYSPELEFVVGPYQYPQEIESRLHNRFEAKNLNREWFELSEDDLRWIKEKLNCE